MSKQSDLFTFIVDDRKFTVTRSTVNNYPSSQLFKVLNGTIKDNCIIVDKDTGIVYVDRDPSAFEYIVDTLRGYEYNVNEIIDLRLKSKVESDLKYFGLCKNEVVIKEEDEIENILKSSNETYRPEEVPLLNKFMELMTKTKTETETETLEMGPEDKTKITDFIKSINEKIQDGGDPFELISALSTDENLKNMIIKNQMIENGNDESDAESLDLNDNDADTNTKTSELVTDISNKLSLHDNNYDKVESIESILKSKSEHQTNNTNKTNYEKVKARYIQIN